MNESKFLSKVRDRGDFDSTAAARKATIATMETLGERLTMGENGNLAAQLPGSVGGALNEYGQVPGKFSFDEFLSRVDERADIEGAIPFVLARAVGVTFAEAVTDEELDNARAQLPPEFDRLFWMADVEEFMATVRDHTALESSDPVRKAATATLYVLGERLSRGEAERLAAFLPEEFATALTAADTEATDHDIVEFVDRVAERELAADEASGLANRITDDEGIDTDAVRDHVRAVLAALAEAVPPEEFDNALQQLPDTYGPLLELVEKESNDGT